ncbi:MAG: bifunctional diaminohydroxyphosphoribosylaminopyrimidine deaminase/5-amino-6-(5-phosphoribosylamino)uracil reductase RibD [Verrucomicrobiota bacterium]
MSVSGQVHERFMREALNLARRGLGLTRPNPPVGAVIVKQKKIVGEGWHRKAGGPHAEVEALRNCSVNPKNATIYITLEPCSTHGRTPPCTEAILKAGIRRVVVSVNDPNPAHAGRGIRLLKKAGLEVETGCCEAEGRYLIAPFAKWVTTGMPYVRLKLAMTLDGKIADREGSSKWITGKAARERVHQLRREADAVMVGAGTVLADNPSLFPRPALGRKPYRVVLTGRRKLPPGLKIHDPKYADRTILTFSSATDPRRVPLRRTLDRLGKKGILQVLCEGGGGLADTLIQQEDVDEYFFFIAPKIIGGAKSIPVVGGQGCLLKEAWGLKIDEVKTLGDDIMIRARPK